MLSKRAFLQAVWGATKRPCLDEAFSMARRRWRRRRRAGPRGRRPSRAFGERS